MVGDGLPGKRRPLHSRHGTGGDARARLAELGRQLPPPSGDAARIEAADRAAWRNRRLAVRVVIVVVVLVVAGSIAQWFRPLTQPSLQGVSTSVRFPGTAPSLPWPSTGQAALGVPGLGFLGRHGNAGPVPIGVLSSVLTAYVVLKDHPLSTGGATGPAIAVTAETLAAYRTGSAAGEPEVPVSSGQSVTELDALEGLIVNAGNDMATLLADWDAKSAPAFVEKMDRSAASLGLRHTRVTQPGGADDAVVSTPEDLIRLGEAAMRIPLFQQIVSLGEDDLPEAGLKYNPNFLLGEDGVVGIEAGSDTATDGCYLFAAQKVVSGQTVVLYGAVLDQSGPIGPDAAAVDAGDALIRAALPALTAAPVFQTGHVVGKLSAPWGASSPVTVSKNVTVPAWPSSSVSVATRLAKVSVPIAAGTRIGVLEIRQGSRLTEVPLRNSTLLPGPSGLWRVTR